MQPRFQTAKVSHWIRDSDKLPARYGIDENGRDIEVTFEYDDRRKVPKGFKGRVLTTVMGERRSVSIDGRFDVGSDDRLNGFTVNLSGKFDNGNGPTEVRLGLNMKYLYSKTPTSDMVKFTAPSGGQKTTMETLQGAVMQDVMTNPSLAPIMQMAMMSR